MRPKTAELLDTAAAEEGPPSQAFAGPLAPGARGKPPAAPAPADDDPVAVAFARAELAAQAADRPEAIARLRAALALGGSAEQRRQAHGWLARLHDELGQAAEAIDALRVLRSDGASPEQLDRLVDLLDAAHAPDRAAALEEVVSVARQVAEGEGGVWRFGRLARILETTAPDEADVVRTGATALALAQTQSSDDVMEQLAPYFCGPEGPLTAASVAASLQPTYRLMSLSWGRVGDHELLDDEGRPARGGLLCERIFGPIEPFACACGAVRGVERAGVICPRCRVEVWVPEVRAYRAGHIELVARVLHPAWSRGPAGLCARLLGIRQKELDGLLRGELLMHLQEDIADWHGEVRFYFHERSRETWIRERWTMDGVRSGIGAIEAMLRRVNLWELPLGLRVAIQNATSMVKREQAERRLALAEVMSEANVRTEDLLPDLVVVLPPDAPVGPQAFGRDFAPFYQRVMAANRLLTHHLCHGFEAPAARLQPLPQGDESDWDEVGLAMHLALQRSVDSLFRAVRGALRGQPLPADDAS